MDFIKEKINECLDYEEARDLLLTDPDFMPELSHMERYELACECQIAYQNSLNEIDEILFESDNTEAYEMLQEVNIRRLDKKTQRQIRKIFVAIQLAKENNDPLYTRYKKGVDLRKKSKTAILNKYGNKAMQLVMQEKDGF